MTIIFIFFPLINHTHQYRPFLHHPHTSILPFSYIIYTHQYCTIEPQTQLPNINSFSIVMSPLCQKNFIFLVTFSSNIFSLFGTIHLCKFCSSSILCLCCYCTIFLSLRNISLFTIKIIIHTTLIYLFYFSSHVPLSNNALITLDNSKSSY